MRYRHDIKMRNRLGGKLGILNCYQNSEEDFIISFQSKHYKNIHKNRIPIRYKLLISE